MAGSLYLASMTSTSPKTKLLELAKLFLTLGCISFGGPAVHIAMMEQEVVRRKQWLTKETFVSLVGATNLIPGPNSTEMAMHIGYLRAGILGLVIAGLCFIVPAVLITGILAWAYGKYHTVPDVQAFIYGLKPAIIAVLAGLMVSLGRTAIKNKVLAAIGLSAFLLTVIGHNEIVILFGAGAAGVILTLPDRGKVASLSPLVFLPLMIPAQSISPERIFWLFLKIGSILYGSGYVLFGFLDAELVSKQLLDKKILVDAIAVGQFTPGPVFSSATFIGWQMNGFNGAVAATIGIFLPAFVFVAFLGPIIKWLGKSAVMKAFLDAVGVASIAIILAVAVDMARIVVTDWRSVLIGVIALAITLRYKALNSAWIVLGGALTGYLLSFV